MLQEFDDKTRVHKMCVCEQCMKRTLDQYEIA